MATDVECEGNEKAKILQDSICKEEEKKEKEKAAVLSVEEYKRLHNIGSRLSTESIITYKESSFLQSSHSDSLLHSVTSSRSPDKINDLAFALNTDDWPSDCIKSGSSPDKHRESKSHKITENINVKYENDTTSPSKEINRQKLNWKNSGDENGEGKSTNKKKSSSKTSNRSSSSEVKKQQKSKKSESVPMPGRRVRREASLNAMAMVNILFEKEPPVPKSPKKRRSSSQADLSTEEKDAPKSPTKKTKSVEKKSEAKTQTKKVSVIKSPKDKKERDSKMILKANSSISKKKMLKFNSNKKLEKVKKVTESKCDTEDNSPDPSKPKKKRKDTRKAARTHEIVIPKRKRCCSGSMCATCFQPLSCQHQSAIYWNNQELPHSENIPRTNSSSDPDDIKPCMNMDMTTSGYSLSRLQHIDNASYVNTMVQHPAMSSHRCPQCAQAAGLLSGCQTYALGGVGSLSSVNLSAVMPYPPAYGGSYTLPYPGTSTLPHCTCPQCLYYSQSGTNISHQPLPSRDHCILSHPPISVQHIEDKHIEDSDTKVAEEIIDVGIEEFPVVQQNAFTKSNSAEKVRKKNSDSKVIKIKSKSSSSEKSTVKPPRKEKGEVQKKSVTEPKAKMSPIKVPKERKKSTSSKKEAKLQRTICLHGWRLHGPMENKKVYSYSIGISFEAQCYQAIQHSDGDIIQVRDCVMLRSGPKTTDIPFVAKVTQFWKHPQDGDVMMSLLWYYHPEHTEGGRKSQHASCELFASKHRDENCVACIDDKGYVLTYNEYCRFHAERLRKETHQLPRSKVVPPSDYPRSSRLPPDDVDISTVFICRQVYDFKLKRILKNPS